MPRSSLFGCFWCRQCSYTFTSLYTAIFRACRVSRGRVWRGDTRFAITDASHPSIRSQDCGRRGTGDWGGSWWTPRAHLSWLPTTHPQCSRETSRCCVWATASLLPLRQIQAGVAQESSPSQRPASPCTSFTQQQERRDLGRPESRWWLSPAMPVSDHHTSSRERWAFPPPCLHPQLLCIATNWYLQSDTWETPDLQTIVYSPAWNIDFVHCKNLTYNQLLLDKMIWSSLHLQLATDASLSRLQNFPASG